MDKYEIYEHLKAGKKICYYSWPNKNLYKYIYLVNDYVCTEQGGNWPPDLRKRTYVTMFLDNATMAGWEIYKEVKPKFIRFELEDA